MPSKRKPLAGIGLAVPKGNEEEVTFWIPAPDKVRKELPKRTHASKVHSRNTREKGPSIPVEEWDFCKDRISDEELGACLLYEYAREKLNRSPTLKKRFVEQTTKGSTFDEYRKLWRYFSGPYGHAPLIHELSSTPWLKSRFAKLSIEEKKEFGVENYKKPKEAIFSGEDAYRAWDFPQGIIPLDYFKLMAPTLLIGSRAWKEEEQDFRFGYFCIDLNSADKSIVDRFTKWLSSQRPTIGGSSKRNAKNDGTGKSFRAINQRTLLKQLGATRLLESGMTAEKAMDFSQKNSKNEKEIYADVKEWTTAKKAVEAGIIKLFPERVR